MTAKESRTKGTSTATQRAYILNYLIQNNSASTIELRDGGIMSPAPRIKELKERGFKIKKVSENQADHVGLKHRGVARYFIAPSDMKETLALAEELNLLGGVYETSTD